MTRLSCPLCSVSLTSASLEAHLREELGLPSLRCLLCRDHFTSEDTAQSHFSGPFSKHPGQAPSLLRLNGDAEKEARLVELARLARGGQREVGKRLCVCGQCQLLCRENIRHDTRVSEELVPQSYDAHSFSVKSYHTSQVVTQAWQPSPMMSRPRDHLEDTLSDPRAESQPVPEPSEPENQPMVDVKPNLEDLKPQLSADGKVACIQCGLRVGKDQFKKHAIGAHSKARPYNCNLCPTSEKSKSDLGKHQRKAHETQMTDETFTFAGSESKIADLVEQCFGAAKDVDWARMRCGPCDKLVNKMDLKYHISMSHLKKTLHTCKLCGYISSELSAGAMNKHIKKSHGEMPGKDTIDSSQAQHYAPIIKNMIPQFFS